MTCSMNLPGPNTPHAPVILVDSNSFEIVDASGSATEYLALGLDDLVGRNFRDLLRDIDSAAFGRCIDQLRSDPNTPLAVPVGGLRTKSGAAVDVLSICAGDAGDHPLLSVCLFVLADGAGSETPAAPRPYGEPAGPFTELSAREHEVTMMVLEGLRVSTIAKRLYLSQSTVRNHLSTAFRKLGVSSQAELIETYGEHRPG